MSRKSAKLLTSAVLFLFFWEACGLRGPDLDDPNIQQGWIDAVAQTLMNNLESSGYSVARTSQGNIKVEQYFRHDDSVCAILIETVHSPPQAVFEGHFVMTDEYGYNWECMGLLGAIGEGEQMETPIFSCSLKIGEGAVPSLLNLGEKVDRYLLKSGRKRKKAKDEDTIKSLLLFVPKKEP